METFSGGLGAALRHTGSKCNRIYRARACGADSLNVQSAVLEQPIDHPPNKGPMRSATLESCELQSQ